MAQQFHNTTVQDSSIDNCHADGTTVSKISCSLVETTNTVFNTLACEGHARRPDILTKLNIFVPGRMFARREAGLESETTFYFFNDGYTPPCPFARCFATAAF